MSQRVAGVAILNTLLVGLLLIALQVEVFVFDIVEPMGTKALVRVVGHMSPLLSNLLTLYASTSRKLGLEVIQVIVVQYSTVEGPADVHV